MNFEQRVGLALGLVMFASTCVAAPELDLGVPQRSAVEQLDLQVGRWDQRLMPSLRSASQRGVRVRVILDPQIESNRRASVALRAPGVELRWASVVKGGLDNAKIMVLVDSKVLWSLGAKSGTDRTRWRLVAKGAEAKEGQTAFDSRWRLAKLVNPPELVLNDALKALPDPRSDDELFPRFKRRSLAAPKSQEAP